MKRGQWYPIISYLVVIAYNDGLTYRNNAIVDADETLIRADEELLDMESLDPLIEYPNPDWPFPAQLMIADMDSPRNV